MCYFLYGGINAQVDTYELEKVENESCFNFSVISKIQESGRYFPCITQGFSDCGTPIGSGGNFDAEKSSQKEKLQNLADYIQILRKIKNIKHI